MSEQFPLFDEQAEHSPNDEYIDVQKSETWEDFIVELQAAEEAMLPFHDLTDEYTGRLAAEYSIKLGETLGYEYNGQPSRVLGLAYSDTAPDETVIFDAQHAIFHGCDLKYINNRWQGAFEFHINGTEENLPNGFYYVPVDKHHILELKIRSDDGEDEDDLTAVQMLHEQSDDAQTLVTTGEFAALSADAQRQKLENICASADSELPRGVRDQNVAIDCDRYYTRYDDMPGFDIRDFMTDSSTASEDNEILVPQGIIEGYDYPELETLPAGQKLNAWNFDIAAGAPCLILRSDLHKRTYYIPPAGIQDIF